LANRVIAVESFRLRLIGFGEMLRRGKSEHYLIKIDRARFAVAKRVGQGTIKNGSG